MRIPAEALSSEALNTLVSQFILECDGNEFCDTPLEERTKLTIEAIEKDEIIILFSQMQEVPFLLTRQECLNRFNCIPAYLGQ